MSTHICGIVPPDEKWKKMKAVYDACVDASLTVPSDVWQFFNDEPPDDLGVIIGEDELGGVEEYNDDCKSGFEVYLDQLPKNVKIIRFYNSY